MNIINANVPGPLLNETRLPLDIIPGECLYSMSYTSVSGITSHLRTYFGGAISPGANGHSSDGPPQLRAMYNDTYASFDSVNQTFHSIAEGITQRIRRYGEPLTLPAAQPALGLVFEQKTCVRVRWPYLAFPAAVAFLTTAFLCAVMGKAALGSAGMVAVGWKSSPLPMLFHGLAKDVPVPVDTNGDAGLTTSLKEMEQTARITTARLNM
ncbi:hypothetical protein PG997_009048 [Apiospora hydei]|uniref:Uncharacterized protein n=1 Tax=Apiospora hydei TaxID=1337664 RepID=A0ABR1VSY3_9PEZI